MANEALRNLEEAIKSYDVVGKEQSIIGITDENLKVLREMIQETYNTLNKTLLGKNIDWKKITDLRKLEDFKFRKY